MKKTKEDAEETRNIVMKAAIKIFSQKGYDSTTIVDIANEAGLTRGAVYWHFKDKGDLFIKLNDEYGHGFVFDLVGQVANDNTISAKDKIRFGLGKYFELLETNENFRALEEIASKMFTSSDSKVNTYFTKEMEEINCGEGMSIISKIIEEGIKNGEIKEDVNIKEFFNAMIALITGTQIIWFMSGKKYSVRERASYIIEGIINSIAK